MIGPAKVYFIGRHPYLNPPGRPLHSGFSFVGTGQLMPAGLTSGLSVIGVVMAIVA